MKNFNIIIVEDEPAILQGLVKLITQMKLQIEITGTYTNGQEALKDLDTAKPDIVITDVQMPIMTGLELIRQMRLQNYPAEFLVLSGYAEFEYIQQALHLNVNNYLLKPPNINELRDALNFVCEKLLRERYENSCGLLQDIISQNYPIQETDPRLPQTDFQVFVCMLGSYVETTLNIWGINFNQWSCSAICDHLESAIQKPLSELWILNGSYPNLKIIVASVGESTVKFDPEKLYLYLKNWVEPCKLPLTMAAGSVIHQLSQLSEAIADCIKTIKEKVQFGENQFLYPKKQNRSLLRATLSNSDRNFFIKIIATQDTGTIIKQCCFFIEKYNKSGYSQAEILFIVIDMISELCNQLLSIQKINIAEEALLKAETAAASSLNFDEFEGKITQLLQEICHNFHDTSSDRQLEDTIGLLWEQIHKDFVSHIDVAEFARIHGYHPVYLISQFSKAKGISPNQLIIQLRMDAAKHLLETTDMNLKSISEAVGYNDVSYFSRSFKEHEGISPDKYRKLHCKTVNSK